MTELNCDMALMVQADFDGELSAADAARVELHRGTCATCRRTYDDLARLRTQMNHPTLRARTSADFRNRLRAQIGGAPAKPNQSRRAWLSATAFAMAAVVAVVMAVSARQPILDEVVASHIRALQADHIADVISTDRHTVKPWFDGKLDFAPPVRDLVAAGFPLKGGRLDYISDRPVAAMVYEHGHHPINLFAWPETGNATAPEVSTRKGFNVIHYRESGMAIWAVSDLETAELARFVALWRAAG